MKFTVKATAGATYRAGKQGVIVQPDDLPDHSIFNFDDGTTIEWTEVIP